MKTRRASRLLIQALVVVGTVLSLGACGTGTVYVGVAAPGPWVGYPPGVYGGYPGYYGRPWYALDPEAPQEDEAPLALDEEQTAQTETGGVRQHRDGR